METYISKYHAGHIYLRVDVDEEITEEQLNCVRAIEDKSIQVIVDADWRRSECI